jgi:hypothetical protein
VLVEEQVRLWMFSHRARAAAGSGKEARQARRTKADNRARRNRFFILKNSL